MHPLFDLGIRYFEPEAPDEPMLMLPCRCMYTWEGHMGWQQSSLCAHHGAMQAALALEMFDLEEHIDHNLGLAKYFGTLCLECHTCSRTLIEISSSGERVTP
jgi:hypothetical protein